MTVAELIEQLKAMPQHHPVLCDSDLMRHEESITHVFSRNLSNSKIGPIVVIRTAEDPRNYNDNNDC